MWKPGFLISILIYCSFCTTHSMYHIAGKFGEIGEFGEITSHSPIKTRQTRVPSSKSSTFVKLFLAKTSRCPIRQAFLPPNFPAIW